MHRNLTVKEVLYYQAMLRLPSGTNRRDVNHRIHQVRLSFSKIHLFVQYLFVISLAFLATMNRLHIETRKWII